MNTKIVCVDEKNALVTKAFQKQASIFGTEEFKLWRAYKGMFPEAVMVTKSIKKNPDRKTNRNLTYENMEKFLKTLPDSERLLQEFETVKTRSCVKTSPYRFTLEWFEATASKYGSYGSFVEEMEEKRQVAEVLKLSAAVNE